MNSTHQHTPYVDCCTCLGIYIVCVPITIPIICISIPTYYLIFVLMKSKLFLDIYGNPITCIHTSALLYLYLYTYLPILKWISLLSFADMLTWHLSGWSYHWCLSPALESVQDPNVMPNYLSIQVSKTVIIHEKESEIGRMLAPTHTHCTHGSAKQKIFL